MKKITLLIVFITLFFGVSSVKAQVINEAANWPNSDWEVIGVFTFTGFTSNPTDNPYTDPVPGANFGFDNWAAGAGSLFDIIAAESPRYDLRAAASATPAEEQVVVNFDYNYLSFGSVLILQYTIDSVNWNDWQEIPLNSASETDYVDCSNLLSFESIPLLITQFDQGELQRFKYRIIYNDNNALSEKGGFCVGSPTLTSRETPLCFQPANIQADEDLLFSDSASISWDDQNGTIPNDGWEIEYGLEGFLQGSGTTVTTFSDPYVITGLEDITCYDVYVRAVCDLGAEVYSEWTGPFNFCTILGPTGCGDVFYDDGGPDGNYSNGISDQVTTICPDEAGDVVTVVFDAFETESCCDWLKVYDGDSTSSPFIGEFKGVNSPGLISATIANGGCLTFKFHSDSSVTKLGWEARILCSPPITCLVPDNLTVSSSSITLHEADISWDDNNDTSPANGWVVEYGEEGFELGTGITVNATTNSLSLIDLNSGTFYCFYVKANCEGTDESFWSGSQCFSTKVGCGDNFYDAGGPLNNYSNSVDETTTICPEEVDEVVTVVFDAFDTESGYDRLKIYDGSSASGPLLGTFEGNTLPGMISGTLANGGCLTFVFHSDSSVNKAGWESRIFCSPPVTCFFPEDLTVEARIHDADITWVDTNTVPSTVGYDIQYGLDGFELGDGTIINTTDTNYTITGLDANTDYCYYVKANCDNSEDSFWQGPVCFTTLCEAFIAPYIEDFENVGQTPDCWTQSTEDDGDWSFSNFATTHFGDNGNIFETQTNSNNYFAYVEDGWFTDGNKYTISSPMVDVSTLAEPTLYFYYVSNNEGGSNVNFSIDIWDGANWNTNFFTSNENTYGWSRMILNLSDLTITDFIQVRFNIKDNNGDRYDDFAIDDVELKEAPSCWPVNDVDITNITTNSVDLSWINENDTVPVGGWDIELTYPTFSQGTGQITTVYTNSVTLDNLVASSTYEIYIRANCSADGSDSSIWSGPYEFTLQNAVPVNNDCSNAIELIPGTSDCQATLGNNIMATSTNPALATNCNADDVIDGVSYNNLVKDVWYKFYMPETGTVTIQTYFAGGMNDSVMAVYRADDLTSPCASLNPAVSFYPGTTNVNNSIYTCRDDSDPNLNPGNADDVNDFSIIMVQNQIPGDLYYIRVWSYNTSVQGQFLICIKGAEETRTSALSEEDVIANNVVLDYYPNPVTNILNLKSNSDIKSVRIYSILGQEVLRKNYDNSVTVAELDMQYLKSGTYFVKALLDNDVIKTFKIVKN